MFRTSKLIVSNVFIITALVVLAACSDYPPTAAPQRPCADRAQAPVQTEAQAPAHPTTRKSLRQVSIGYRHDAL
jgi:uncharacterized lipoprotein YajG